MSNAASKFALLLSVSGFNHAAMELNNVKGLAKLIAPNSDSMKSQMSSLRRLYRCQRSRCS